MFQGNIDAASNRATWSENLELTDEETGEPIDLTDVDEITITVREERTQVIALTGTYTGGEIIIVGSPTDGTFQWRFEASAMRALCAKTYEVGCTIEQDDDEVQLIIGRIAILDGIVN